MGMQARPRPQVMSVTDAAAAKVREILGRFDPPLAGLRVGVKNAGCAGMTYTLDPVEEPNPADDIVTDKGVTLYVDSKAVLFLLGSVMDHRTTKFSSGFVFENPNQVGECGCGESVKLKPAKPEAETAH
jgi:iron-sulfur cluster assembly protein